LPAVVRSIVEFRQDEEGHWVALLDCGHRQHTRHAPPFVERPWVLSAAGRRARLGHPLDCRLCDEGRLPQGYRPYRRTPTFTAASLPAALRSRHRTKRGVWGVVHVVTGRVRYRVHEPFGSERVLEAGAAATVLPEVPHEVEPLGEAELYVEFWRREDG
jgi:tellurite methyltransferase